MKSDASGFGRVLREELRGLSDYHFQERCRVILSTVFRDVHTTAPRRQLDRKGIDHFVFVKDENAFEAVFQCKGFEVPDLTSVQVRDCIDSIESFERSSVSSQKYFLIVNRIVKGPQRQEIESAIARLVSNGKVTEATLFDLHAFLDLISRRAKEHVRTLIHDSLRQFEEEHRTRMEESLYVADVPFSIDTPLFSLGTNPMQKIATGIRALVAKANNARSRTVISAEFGFGKTSLALRLSELLQNEGISSVYLPVAVFPQRAFDNEFEFLWSVLEILTGDSANRERDQDRVLHAALKEILKKEKKIVLIIDGFDEHPICWRESGIFNVFQVLEQYNCFCILVARSEFLAALSGVLEAAMKKGPKAEVITLTEWTPTLVLYFTREWRKTRPATDSEGLDHFENAVSTGEYVQFYGDIPTRPLFLKMLLEDVERRDVRKIFLAELYADYLSRKFIRDRESSTINPAVRRPLNIEEDYTFLLHSLFDVMSAASGKMVAIEDQNVRLEPSIEEAALRCCLETSGRGLDWKSLLGHSVLVPVGHRKVYEGRLLRFSFAHRSFQEFFLARFLLGAIKDISLKPEMVNSHLPTAVTRFSRGLFASMSDEDRSRIRAHLNNNGNVSVDWTRKVIG